MNCYVMLRKCQGNWECQNTNCIFRELSGGVNNKYQISNGVCEECNQKAVFVNCSAIKATKVNDRHDAITKIWYDSTCNSFTFVYYTNIIYRVYHDGEHMCVPPSIPDIPDIVDQEILHNTHIYPRQSMYFTES